MALNPIQLPGYRPREPSTMEQIALGVDMASKVLGTGLDAYKLFKVDIPKGQAETKKLEAEAADLPGTKDLARRVGESTIEANRATAAFNSVTRPIEIKTKEVGLAKSAAELKKSQEEEKFGKKLSENTIDELTAAQGVPAALQNVYEIIDKNVDLYGPFGGRAGSINPYDTKAQTINSKMKAEAQRIGKYLEGGVLKREDEIKYEKMLPQLSDTPEVARNKAAIVAKMVKEKFENNYKNLKASGYDTRAFEKSPLTTLQIPNYMGGESPAAAPNPSVGPHGPSVTQGGVVFNWNPQSGKYE